MVVARELVTSIRSELRTLADPDRAVKAQAYMKSTMPFLGVRVPQVRTVVRAAARQRPVESTTALRDTVLELWRDAEFREERYAATELLAATKHRRLVDASFISLYEEIVVTGAWWDHVDEISHRVGDLLLAFPEVTRPIIVSWQRSPDHWLRRTSIICQLGHGSRTDLDLLTGAIEASADESDFFLRKAIGWALRHYARTDPQWVRKFLANHDLSPLSVREASKHL